MPAHLAFGGVAPPKFGHSYRTHALFEGILQELGRGTLTGT